MTTIINNTPDPRPSEDSSAVGIIVGVLIALVLIALFVIYILPGMRGTSTEAEPAGASATLNVTIPNNSDSTGTTKP